MIHWKSLGTEEKIQAILAVWEPGITSRYIAARFDGATRNAVIGIYNRYPDELMHCPLPTTKRAATAERKGRMVSLCRPASKPLRTVTVVSHEAHLCGKPMMMLQAKECRWPVNDAAHGDLHLFCGIPSETVYCEHHARRAILPPKTGNALNNNRNRL